MKRKTTSTLSFELPPILKGLEELVRDRALRLAHPDDPQFEEVLRLVAGELRHTVLGLQYLGRIAADKDSLYTRVFAEE